MRFFGVLFSITALLYAPASLSIAQPSLAIQPIDSQTYQLTLKIPIAQGDALYADSIFFSVDHPDVTLSQWNANSTPKSKYDTDFKQTKKIYNQPVTLSLQAQVADPILPHATLHLATISRHDKNQQFDFPLQFSPIQSSEAARKETEDTASMHTHDMAQQNNEPASFRVRLLTLFSETDSWFIRLALALLLGFILSLTPCIYPMIPITIGILQSQGSTSITRNFFIAFTYVMGIATTFASLGTAAALSGKMFGSFMKNPMVILVVIVLLAYLAGSMIGLYDLYLPRFMQTSNNHAVKKGSFFSIFLFGAASGTVASPCISPGLILLLSMVTALGNAALGFILLFFFGIGLGIPLLVIGTFSGSLRMLPQAGTWMVGVKQFFGFFMLATCLYFLGTILPAYSVGWLAVLLSAGVGIFYFFNANQSAGIGRFIKNLLGIIAIALSVYIAFDAYKNTDIYFSEAHQNDIWLHDYAYALSRAQTEQKKLFIDISAPYCSICKAIDKKIFANKRVQEKLAHYIAVKIEDIEANETTLSLQKQFAVIGAPTILVYDPIEKKELKRWGGELYELSPEEFIEILY